ncbi:MAG TPA: HD domain-containing phosphohydrolase [Spirochaetia bacterium]|nr:HD domain-containing phosphohydrolase [Spirochaetia bacterium]
MKSTQTDIVSGLGLTMPPLEPRVLVVDDDTILLRSLRLAIRSRGLVCDTAETLAAARQALTRERYGILFLDLALPDGTGTSLLDEPGRVSESSVVVIITAEQGMETVVRVVRKGAYDFICKPFGLELFEERLEKSVQEWRYRHRARSYQDDIDGLISSMTDELKRAESRIDEIYDMTVNALGAALDLRDPETEEHCQRVAANAVTLGKVMGVLPSDLRNLKWGAYLHDIGKIGIPEQVLSKPGPLTPQEMDLVRVHPVLGHRLILRIDFLRDAAEVVLCHHERYDGTGYPQGLRGEAIPLHARIFALIDAQDAMLYDRPYRKALTRRYLEEELRSQAGRHFDPRVVEAFLRIPEQAWTVNPDAS